MTLTTMLEAWVQAIAGLEARLTTELARRDQAFAQVQEELGQARQQIAAHERQIAELQAAALTPELEAGFTEAIARLNHLLA
jgi:uncharacterized protein HemX